MDRFVKLKPVSVGDQVAIISPSAGLPGLFPWVQDLGLERLQNQFGLKSKEYPTTRKLNSRLEERARDIMNAFSDPENKAVIASIGGEDQIKLLKYLDPNIFTNNPKPFFGYSDNTHLHNFLWNLGIPSFYGGSIMTEFAFHQEIPTTTKKYLEHALFKKGQIEVVASEDFNDIGLNWSDPKNLDKQLIFEPNEGMIWDGRQNAEGHLWGGCVESLVEQFTVGKYLPSEDKLENAVLFIETAEDIPEEWIVEYLLVGLGERGWFNLFNGVLVGRPKAWEFDKPNSRKEKADYKKRQRDVVVRTIREYNSEIPIVQNMDFGHTAPQIVLPYGGYVHIDSETQNIKLTY